MTDGPVIVRATVEAVVVVDGETVVVVTGGTVVVGEFPLDRLFGADVVDADAVEVVVDALAALDALAAPAAPVEVGEVTAPRVSFAGIE